MAVFSSSSIIVGMRPNLSWSLLSTGLSSASSCSNSTSSSLLIPMKRFELLCDSDADSMSATADGELGLISLVASAIGLL